jgi:DNA polymerase III subunit gamma/tau
MAYLALYRTYRPKSFSQVVGQKAIVKTLQNALKDGKIAHAYLFCGPRGTGKTTMARLFAKALNCSEGVGHECNVCANCTAILEGRHPDVYEIDAASNSGVDNVRQLIEQVSFAPIMGRYKVYIIDEVHSMSSSAFNALLKTLEEPPANVVFILATTEPDKVLPTILSRVQRYDFSKVSDKDLIDNMANILGQEKIDYEENALKTIARMSQGGVRDSLSLLDQAISFSGNKITSDDVDSLFGLLSITDEMNLVRMIHLNDVKGALNLVKGQYAKGADILRLHEDLTNIYKDLLIYGTTKDASLLTMLLPEEAQQLLVTPREIRRNIDVLVKARRDYKTALNAYDLFELTIITLACGNEEETVTEVKTQSVPAAPIQVAPVQVVQSVPITAEAKPVAVPAAEEKKTIEPEVKPAVNVKDAQTDSESKKEEPKTITSSTIERFDEQSLFTGEGYNPTQDDVINFMVQGDKTMKKDLQNVWEEKLNDFPKSDELAYLADYLSRSKPVIVCQNLIVVNSFFKGVAKNINLYENQDKLSQMLKRVFDFDGKVVALFNSDYVDLIRVFMNLAQANTLPKPRPISIPDGKIPKENKKLEDENKTSNAQDFINSLK